MLEGERSAVLWRLAGIHQGFKFVEVGASTQ